MVWHKQSRAKSRSFGLTCVEKKFSRGKTRFPHVERLPCIFILNHVRGARKRLKKNFASSIVDWLRSTAHIHTVQSKPKSCVEVFSYSCTVKSRFEVYSGHQSSDTLNRTFSVHWNPFITNWMPAFYEFCGQKKFHFITIPSRMKWITLLMNFWPLPSDSL